MRITRHDVLSKHRFENLIRKTAVLFFILLAFVLLRRGILVVLLALKILGHSGGLDAWSRGVHHQTAEHDGIPIDIYSGAHSYSPILIVHGVNPTGKDSPDLVRISEALAQSGYRVFVPDFLGMRTQHLTPEEADHIKSAFQFIGRDAGMACFSYGCGPAMIAAADPEIAGHVRFALAFGGYFDLREALQYVVTGPETPIAYLKWVYLAANADLVKDETDRARLRTIAEHQGGEGFPVAEAADQLSPDAKALLDIFSAATPEEFTARLKAGPEALHRRLDALSPSRIIRNIRAPLILVHGVNDPVIPARQSVEFANAARAHGLEYNLTLLSMYGHVNPILPAVGLKSLVSFYAPETLRFLWVINRLVGFL